MKSMFKGILLAVFALGLSSGVFAQSDAEEVEMVQAMFGMEKKAIMADFLGLPAEDPFWAVYDSYETERKELGKKRIALLKDYATNYATMDDAKMNEMVKHMTEQRKETDRLIDKYHASVNKTSGAKVAAQFYQLEYYILSAVRVEILANIPFIGDLDN